MKVLVSCHCDTVYKEPFARVVNGEFIGACDNFAAMMAIAQLINETGENFRIEFTEDEEMHMDGARYVAVKHNPSETFIIVLDVTEKKRWTKKVQFTVENWSGITEKHIRKALASLRGRYKFNKAGQESEAWLYRSMGYAVVELDVPVLGGNHSLDGKVKVSDILALADATRAMRDYMIPLKREDISDIYKVGESNG